MQQSPKPVAAKLVVIWEGLMEVLLLQRHLVLAILKGNGVGELIIHRFLWSTDAERLVVPERSQSVI